MATIRAYKCTRSDGTDFYTGTVDYGGALASGEYLEVDAEPENGNVCGRGLHVCNAPRKTIRFANRSYRPYRWFEVEVEEADVVEQDKQKMRVRRLRVVCELTLADLFGPDFAGRIKAVRAEALTWGEIPWLRPAFPVEDGQLGELFAQWHAAITPWLQGRCELPAKWRVVRDRKAADAAAAAADDNAAVVAADDNAAVVAADDNAADAAADDAAAATGAASAAADAAASGSAGAGAADAAADAADASMRFPWWRWHLRPRYVLWRYARWRIAGIGQPNLWEPLVGMYRLGAMPIGYVRGEFVIYLPQEGGA